MATHVEDPRAANRIIRVEGKNISKLKRFFDSSETHSRLDDASNQKFTHGKSSNSLTQSDVVIQDGEPDFKSGTSGGVQDIGITNSDLCVSSSQEVNSVHFDNNCQKSISLSDIPFCKKVTQGNSLWENVNIGLDTNNRNGLWSSSDDNSFLSGEETSVDSYEMPNSTTSTADLHNLIVSSRNELSKLRDMSISNKSDLESYFSSFENTKPPEASDRSECYVSDQFFSSSYDCDINNMSFEDEEAVLSDVSSDEDIRSHPALINPNYLPAYALHTIIEESCEESERDSQTATPTNNAETSKLERYFSWDIVNDAELKKVKKEDDESTIYSDSLSDGSVGDTPKDVDPSQLVSSRLEKYFMSGLVDDQNYFYPDDAEFLDDPPVSDFEEDRVHQKISRSALLSSLETKPNPDCPEPDESFDKCNLSAPVPMNSTVDVQSTVNVCANNSPPTICDNSVKSSNQPLEINSESKPCAPIIRNLNLEDCDEAKTGNDSSELIDDAASTSDGLQNNIDIDLSKDHSCSEALCSNLLKTQNSSFKQLSSKQKITVDIQSIIQKLISHFTVASSSSLSGSLETDYTSAWQMLENEIDRLLNTISPSALEHNSCNSSMVDSNNSDYGSDTVESMDCLTDDDDCSDSKSRLNAKCPLADILKPYKLDSNCDLNAFNISDETLGIWKRLIQSLQKDNVILAKNKMADPNAEARLYIKNQIVTLMHTVTVNDNVLETEKVCEVFDVSENEEKLNEAFNVSIKNSNAMMQISEDIVPVMRIESSDEGISSTDSNENIHFVENASASNRKSSLTEEDVKNTLNGIPSRISPDQISSSKESYNFLDGKVSALNCEKGSLNNEGELKFSVFVNIELEENNPIASDTNTPEKKEETKKSFINKTISEDEDDTDSSNEMLSSLRKEQALSQSANLQHNCNLGIGYFSYKSCDDSLLNTSSPSSENIEVPNFKSLKRSVKKFPIPSNTLSKSANNIFQTFSTPDAKFSTLQLKSKKTKASVQSPSRNFTSLFSPSSVLKRITGSKNNGNQNSESPIPAKYLKKYAKSPENENLFGAVSMPHLNTCKPGDSYSALGLYSEHDPDNSVPAQDEVDTKRYFSGSQSVLSLGSHSASMTSVYSASGCHYGYVNISGDVLFGLNYNQKSQMMEVFVKQCRNLAAIDIRHNKSNPYVKVYLLPDKTKSGKKKTKTKKNTLNPVFNELLRFPVLKNELESRTLWLSVWNSDLFGRNEFLGEISLPLGYRLLDSPTLRWYPLQERAESLMSPLHYRGEVFLALKYVPRDLSLESRFRPAPVISARGALHVLVKEARNISANKSTLDAFCKSYLLPDKSKSSKQKTPVVRKSRHPKWYYTVIYEDLSIDDLRERSLELTVWDHDKITSNEFMGGVRLNTGSGLYHGVPVEWMDARRDESALWLAMLESPNMWVDGCLPLRPTLQSHCN